MKEEDPAIAYVDIGSKSTELATELTESIANQKPVADPETM